jgi:hypothetical protein
MTKNLFKVDLFLSVFLCSLCAAAAPRQLIDIAHHAFAPHSGFHSSKGLRKATTSGHDIVDVAMGRNRIFGKDSKIGLITEILQDSSKTNNWSQMYKYQFAYDSMDRLKQKDSWDYRYQGAGLLPGGRLTWDYNTDGTISVVRSYYNDSVQSIRWNLYYTQIYSYSPNLLVCTQIIENSSWTNVDSLVYHDSNLPDTLFWYHVDSTKAKVYKGMAVYKYDLNDSLVGLRSFYDSLLLHRVDSIYRAFGPSADYKALLDTTTTWTLMQDWSFTYGNGYGILYSIKTPSTVLYDSTYTTLNQDGSTVTSTRCSRVDSNTKWRLAEFDTESYTNGKSTQTLSALYMENGEVVKYKTDYDYSPAAIKNEPVHAALRSFRVSRAGNKVTISLPKPAVISGNLYCIDGKIAFRLFNNWNCGSGFHSISIPKTLGAGVYVCTIATDDKVVALESIVYHK